MSWQLGALLVWSHAIPLATYLIGSELGPSTSRQWVVTILAALVWPLVLAVIVLRRLK